MINTTKVAANQIADLLAVRLTEGQMTTWFDLGSDRSLVFASNGVRAMVLLFIGDGDVGEHAISLGETGSSDGYVLENGQPDTYPDADTVPIAEAYAIVASFIADGKPPASTTWQIDR